MERFQARRKKPKTKIVPLIIIVVVAILGYFLLKLINFYQAIYTPQDGSAKKVSHQDKHVYNIAFLGYGGAGHDGAYLTDSIMIVHLDLKKNHATLLSLPRDIWVKIPTKSSDEYHTKINAVYQMGLFPEDYPDLDPAYGGDGKLVKHVIEQVTGLPIDNYATVDFSGFKKAIDILGGIDINVEKTFDDYEYPIDGKENELCGKEEQFKQIEPYLSRKELSAEEQEKKINLLKEKPELDEYLRNATDSPVLAFPCRYEHLHFDKGPTHMDGETALKYVRSRHSLQDGTDFGRARRQQLFVEAVKNKVISIGFVTKIIPLLDEFKDHMKTDIDPELMQKFISKTPQAGSIKKTNLILSNDNFLTDSNSSVGEYILIPQAGEDDWSEVKKWIDNSIKGITPTPIPSITDKLNTPTKNIQ